MPAEAAEGVLPEELTAAPAGGTVLHSCHPEVNKGGNPAAGKLGVPVGK